MKFGETATIGAANSGSAVVTVSYKTKNTADRFYNVCAGYACSRARTRTCVYQRVRLCVS